MKRRTILCTFIAMMTAVLVACSTVTPAAVPAESPAPTIVATYVPVSDATPVAVDVAPLSPTAEPFTSAIKIATQSPLSGPLAFWGIGLKNAAQLAVEQLAAPLTDLGFAVELVPFDDEATAEKGVANANNIVADPDILCVNGHLNSGVTLPALPVYQAADLVLVSPAATNPDITDGFANSYRFVGRDDVQGAVGEQFAREELQITSVYIIHDQTDYGQGIAEFFRKNAEQNGIVVLGFEGTQETAVFDSILTSIAATDPELIYFAGIYTQAAPFFEQARARGITAHFFGPDGMDSSELVDLAGDAVEGMYYTSVAAPASQFPNAAAFASTYRERFKEEVPPFAAQSYDATGACIAAIAKAARNIGGKPTRKQVWEAMRKLDVYTGITGNYTFNDNGDPQEATYFVLRVNTADWQQNELVKQLVIAAPTGSAVRTP